MKQSIADIADKYTILRLKKVYGLDVEENLDEYECELMGVDFSELSQINRIMWHIEELISVEKDLRNVGNYCLDLRFLNLKRVEAKNKISENHGEHLERKSY